MHGWATPREQQLVVVLVYPGVQLLDVSGPLGVFAAANAAGADYRTLVVSVDGGPVVSAGGLQLVPATDLTGLTGRIGTLVVPGTEGAADPADAAVVEQVREAAAASERTAAICAGAFLLAEAGLLDGRRATTHWRLVDRLRERFPRIEVDPDAIFVRDGTIFSSAGSTAGIDLCLALVEADHGPALAREVARELVVYLQRPGGQAQFRAGAAVPPTDDAPLRKLLEEVAADPTGDHRTEELAERVGYSPRHLTRVFRRELGTTPGDHVERVRLEAARALLEASDDPLGTIAEQAGLGTVEVLRRVCLRQLGVTPEAYRQRFRTSSRPAG